MNVACRTRESKILGRIACPLQVAVGVRPCRLQHLRGLTPAFVERATAAASRIRRKDPASRLRTLHPKCVIDLMRVTLGKGSLIRPKAARDGLVLSRLPKLQAAGDQIQWLGAIDVLVRGALRRRADRTDKTYEGECEAARNGGTKFAHQWCERRADLRHSRCGGWAPRFAKRVV
jgi:hypothetical protein